MTRVKKTIGLVVILALLAAAFAAGVCAKDKETKEKIAKLICKIKKQKLLRK